MLSVEIWLAKIQFRIDPEFTVRKTRQRRQGPCVSSFRLFSLMPPRQRRVGKFMLVGLFNSKLGFGFNFLTFLSIKVQCKERENEKERERKALAFDHQGSSGWTPVCLSFFFSLLWFLKINSFFIHFIVWMVNLFVCFVIKKLFFLFLDRWIV